MTRRGDEIKVGVVVMGVGAIILITVFTMLRYNPFQVSSDEYFVRLKFAGGLEKDAIVRFGGMKRGKVASVRLNREGGTPAEILLRLERGTPVKTDSVAHIAALSALGENYIEISPGEEDSPLLKPGQTIRSKETVEFSEVFEQFRALSDDARNLMEQVNESIGRISTKADTLLGNLNKITGPENQRTFSSVLEGADRTIGNANELITRTSPKVDAIASNLQSGTAKIDQLMSRVEEATTKTNELLKNVDSLVTENRPQVKKDLEALDATLSDMRKLLGEATEMLGTNRGDIDTMIEEFRRSSENLREFTDTIKQRPFSLVRVKAKPDRKVPK